MWAHYAIMFSHHKEITMNQLDMYNMYAMYIPVARYCVMPMLTLYLRDQRIDVGLQVLGSNGHGGFDYRIIHGDYLRSDIQSHMSAVELADADFLISSELEMAGSVNLIREELEGSNRRSVKNARLK